MPLKQKSQLMPLQTVQVKPNRRLNRVLPMLIKLSFKQRLLWPLQKTLKEELLRVHKYPNKQMNKPNYLPVMLRKLISELSRVYSMLRRPPSQHN